MNTPLLRAAALFLLVPAPASAAGFSFQDKQGAHLDVLLDGKVVVRYMYAHDKSTPERLHETYKPYLHVFDAEGKQPITKGPGGQYTHHRGVFIGWNKMGYNGKTYDRWHMKGGEQVHKKFEAMKADGETATFTSVVHWNDEAGKPIVEEERTTTFRKGPASGQLLIDFASTIKAPGGDLMLDGDPEHAGVHFRPADEMSRKDTTYFFPKEGAVPTKDLDYPWVGETFTLGGKKHSVVHMNHPDNPKETKYSAYRDYGRFGAFLKHPIKKGESLTVKYRFLVAEGSMPAADVIQKTWDDYAGAKTPTPTPKLTVVGGGAKSK